MRSQSVEDVKLGRSPPHSRPIAGTKIGLMYDTLVSGDTYKVVSKHDYTRLRTLRDLYGVKCTCLGGGRYRALSEEIGQQSVRIWPAPLS